MLDVQREMFICGKVGHLKVCRQREKSDERGKRRQAAARGSTPTLARAAVVESQVTGRTVVIA